VSARIRATFYVWNKPLSSVEALQVPGTVIASMKANDGKVGVGHFPPTPAGSYSQIGRQVVDDGDQPAMPLTIERCERDSSEASLVLAGTFSSQGCAYIGLTRALAKKDNPDGP
jgi:hypothetical protein